MAPGTQINSVVLSRGLFFESRHLRPGCKRVLDFRQRDATRLQQNEEVKHKIGALGDQMFAIVLDRGDHGFDRLFAEFLGAMIGAFVQKFARIRHLRIRRGASIDNPN